ncbi:hypothetical protein ACOMHN_007153 [Nucella lapillus]
MDESLDIADQYRAIFDLCDDRKDGFIDVNHFKELVKAHSGTEGFNLEIVTGVINLLDPEGRGLISYDDFSQGVQQILKIQQGQVSRFNSTSSESFDSVLSPDLIHTIEKSLSEEDAAFSTDQAGVCNGSGGVTNPSKNGTSSKTKTPTSGLEGDSTQGHGEGGFLGESAFVTPQFQTTIYGSEDEGDSVISGHSEVNESSRPDVTDEESYEAFGEVESEADISDTGLTPVIPRKRGEKKDLLSARNPKKLCHSRLSPRCDTPNSTGHSSSEEVFDNIDENFHELHGRVKYLEGQLLHLTKDQVETKGKQVRLKDDNGVLVSRVLFLEEQLRDMELKTQDRITSERRTHQENMSRRDREKAEDADFIRERLHRTEKDYESLKEETSGLRHEISRLRTEKTDLQERMLEKQEMYNVLYDDHEQLKGEYHKQGELHQRERRSTQQLVDELGKELEDLRRYRQEIETGVRLPGTSGPELPGRYLELQDEIHKLQKENKNLRDSNEDLNVQLVTRCVAEGKSLLHDGVTASLAEELDLMTKEELLKKLGQEQEYNLRLKQYIDRMLLIILEKSPSILEINEIK